MIIKFNTAIYFNSIKKNYILHLMYYIQNVSILENLKPIKPNAMQLYN